MVPGFERELMTAKDRGIRYAVFVGKRNISEKQLEHPSSVHDIRIAPVVSGSKAGGLFQTIAGVALAVVGGAMMFFGNPYGVSLMALGIGLALGGISQMISPQPATRLQSYDFNGADNVTQQGGPVPLLYGRMRVGSTVISEAMLAEDGTANLVNNNYVATSSTPTTS